LQLVRRCTWLGWWELLLWRICARLCWWGVACWLAVARVGLGGSVAGIPCWLALVACRLAIARVGLRWCLAGIACWLALVLQACQSSMVNMSYMRQTHMQPGQADEDT
jgi:hypothetical protein